MSYNFKVNHIINPFQSYCRYLLSDIEKDHTYLYNLCILPVISNLDELKGNNKMLEKLSLNAFYTDVFNMKIKNLLTKINLC